jgi:hypothetical protein
VTLGDETVDAVVASEPTWISGNVERLALTIDAACGGRPFNLRAGAAVRVEFDGQPQAVLAGYVLDLTWGDEVGIMTVGTPMLDFAGIRMGGLATSRVPPLEVFWSMVQAAGWPRERIAAGELRLDTNEPFVVTCPVVGVKPRFMSRVGQVLFTEDRRIADAIRLDKADPALIDQFRDATCWATATVRSRLAYDAERTGVHLIDTALAWMSLTANIGITSIHESKNLDYQRATTRSRPYRIPVVYVEGQSSKRMWMRGRNSTDSGPLLTDLDELGLPNLPAELGDPTLLEAITSWRRAVDATEPFAVCSALCEAVECAVSKQTGKKLFQKADREALKRALPSGLSTDQRKRVEDLIGGLNRPSLMMKVDALATERGITVPAGDRDSFLQVRSARNNFVHGRGQAEIDPIHLERAIGWVARFIAEVVLTSELDSSNALGLLRVSPKSP